MERIHGYVCSFGMCIPNFQFKFVAARIKVFVIESILVLRAWGIRSRIVSDSATGGGQLSFYLKKKIEGNFE